MFILSRMLECSNARIESNRIAIVTGFSNRGRIELNRIERARIAIVTDALKTGKTITEPCSEIGLGSIHVDQRSCLYNQQSRYVPRVEVVVVNE